MLKIMNEKNECDQIANADAIQGPIERVLKEEIMVALKHLKIGMAPGPSQVYAVMILASGDVEIRVLKELCQRIQEGKGMPADRATSVAIPIFKEKVIS